MAPFWLPPPLLILLPLTLSTYLLTAADSAILPTGLQDLLTWPSRQLDEEWRQFKWRHAKEYSGWLEEYYRRIVWESNHRRVLHHNLLAASGHSGFTLGMNQFADMTSAEFASVVLSRRLPGATKRVRQLPLGRHLDSWSNGAPLSPPPPEVDWRLKGCVSPVRDQGAMGSSAVYGVVGSAEGLLCADYGRQPSWLSSQQVIDCANSTQTVTSIYDYLASNLGRLDAESCYPETGHKGPCAFRPDCAAAVVLGVVDVPAGSEAALQTTVAVAGPTTVAVDASRPSFQLYRAGVYNEPNCSTTALDHVMLAVGYGTADAGQAAYWLVKNSWGSGWGEAGYIRMSRNRGNQCCIASGASVPAVTPPPRAGRRRRPRWLSGLPP